MILPEHTVISLPNPELPAKVMIEVVTLYQYGDVYVVMCSLMHEIKCMILLLWSSSVTSIKFDIILCSCHDKLFSVNYPSAFQHVALDAAMHITEPIQFTITQACLLWHQN